VPILTRSAGAEAELMKALYDEHAPVLWRYALRLTGNRTRAETWRKRCYYGRGSIMRLSAAPSDRHGPGCSPSPAT
jgi:hypothetical protein